MNARHGIKAEEIARRCGVDIATARRWKRGITRTPQSALMILEGDLGAFDPAWRGWTLRDGQLISPEGWEATPGDVLSIPLLRAQISTYQAKERMLQRMEEQPLPGAMPAGLA
jgi:transcriptional regulator with XRE-family HTH domain